MQGVELWCLKGSELCKLWRSKGVSLVNLRLYLYENARLPNPGQKSPSLQILESLVTLHFEKIKMNLLYIVSLRRQLKIYQQRKIYLDLEYCTTQYLLLYHNLRPISLHFLGPIQSEAERNVT